MLYTALCALFLAYVNADMYLHWPRGSNNRLNEQSANRNNANRLFDSQNNNRGGYNVGDLDPVNGFEEDTYMATFTEMYDFRFLYQENQLRKQYEMMFLEESWISVTWTIQHGAGNAKLSSHMILQYICDTFPRDDPGSDDNGHTPPQSVISSGTFSDDSNRISDDMAATLRRHGLRVTLYNGGNTDTPNTADVISIQDSGNDDGISSTYTDNNNNNNGRRESEEWYALCERRMRNYGLFHADQDLDGYTQIYTRQNPDGTRRGLECPEERDYYPYWNPTPFHDIAIMTADVDFCEKEIAPHSQNVEEKYSCVRPVAESGPNAATNWLPDESYVLYNLNETACEEAGGNWESFGWDGEEPECVNQPWSKVNHLGNVEGTTVRGGKQAHYDWQLPSYSDLVQNHYCFGYSYTVYDNDASIVGSVAGAGDRDYNCVRMMFRIRYNMSTMDYDPYKTNSSYDEYDSNDSSDEDKYVISPIEQNPEVDVGVYAQGLRLAINTAQTGRTFEDNTHTFLVCERQGSTVENMDILNIGVRGKRGNIVQTFPATEYDFEPQHVYLDQSDTNACMHFQWTGSNTHNNGNPAGDGQAGNDGQGREGSDRSNFVEMMAMDQSYPLTYDKFEDDFFDFVDCYHPLYPGVSVSSDDARLILGTAGFYKSVDYAETHVAQSSGDTGDNTYRILDPLLNYNSGAFRQGLICCRNDKNIDFPGTDNCQSFSFVSTRNNNFSNRAQKMAIELCNSDGISADDAQTDKW